MAAVAAGSSVLTVTGSKLLDWRVNRKVAKKTDAEAGKFDAEAVHAITSAAVALVAPLQSEITKLSARVDTLEEENSLATTKLELAIGHIRALLAWISDHLPQKSPPPPPSALGI